MTDRTASGYDVLADRYALRLFNELDGKPYDRQFLIDFERDTPPGPILDLGCGPGHVATFIADLGRAVTGIDLSPGMVAKARELSAGMEFRRGDMRALDVEDSSFAGVVAFYSIIHLTQPELVQAVREIHRVLVPGGRIALAFHVGDEVRHVDSLWGVQTDLDFRFFQPSAIKAVLASADLQVVHEATRPPYAPEIESQTNRCYLAAVRRVSALRPADR